MGAASLAQFGALVFVLLVAAPTLGRYMARVYQAGPTRGDRVFGPIERVIYRTCRVDPDAEQRWSVYAMSLLAFSAVSFLVVYGMLRLQGQLPLNPLGLQGVVPHLSFNTAVSFMTNTNWQSYGGETTMSHLSQMVVLAVQNFVSAAAGMAVMATFIRGLARRRARTVGNFWVDLVRGTVRILLPLSFVMAVFLVSQGVVQNFHGHTDVATLEGVTQSIPGGPVASQVAIKQLGSNGGGFFNVNSAHPLENPTTLNGFVELLAILLIPFALAFTFGEMVGDRRQGRAVFVIMLVIWAAMAVGTMAFEAGGSLEGKEVRFGQETSGLWAASTTGTSNGSVNAMHDSLTPAAGGLAMAHMMLGELSPGGVGVGLNGLLVMVILSVFIAGLMVGRTPEYLGKKIQAAEMKMVVLYLLAMPVVLLGFAAASVLLEAALPTTNGGAHGLSEVLYAFSSAANNNGSAFAGLNTATAWYDTTLGLAMLVGRFFLIIPVLGIAGSLAAKQAVPASGGTFPTHTPLFGTVVVGVVAVVAGLTFFPALALGPIVEQLSL